MLAAIEFNQKTYKSARRYLKQYHPKVWVTMDENDAYTVIVTAMDYYEKSRTLKHTPRRD